MWRTDGSVGVDIPWSRTSAIYVAWVVILVVSLAAGGYTLGFFVDTETIGTTENPNSFRAVSEWSGFTVANTGLANTDEDSDTDDGTANTQSSVESDGLLACELNAFCRHRGLSTDHARTATLP